MKVDNDKMIAEIDLIENAAYVVKDGQLTKITSKEFGQDIIIWKDGKVLDIDRSQRVRLVGQESI